MKRHFLSLIAILAAFSFCTHADAQYYYKDILSHGQGQEKFNRQKNLRVSAVSVKSFESQGEPSEGFYLEQRISSGFTQVKTVMETPFSGRMSMTNFYTGTGQLYKTTDSGYQTYALYEYTFDSLGKLMQISHSAQAIGEKTKSVELHQWHYDKDGRPVEMLKIRDQSDTSEIKFKLDEQGRVAEEYSMHKGIQGEKTYYYYNDQGQMTDIVRYNERAKKLVPDFMFDYYPDGKLKQMVTLDAATLQSTTWIYLYEDNGLVKEEKCYNNQKKLSGRMVYDYSTK